jgi:tetratricopeptide (TPR) repeat protein
MADNPKMLKASHINQMEQMELLAACQQARRLCEIGDYVGAREAVTDIWSGFGCAPDLANLTGLDEAAVLYTIGMVATLLGQARQVAGAQEFAKDLLTKALLIYSDFGDEATSAEVQITVAHCYLREDAFAEAQALLQTVLTVAGLAPETRLRALLCLVDALRRAGQHDEALRMCAEMRAVAQESRDVLRLAIYHNTFASVLHQQALEHQRPELLAEAAHEYRNARHLFEVAGHLRYVNFAENNLALALASAGHQREAHASLDRALNYFERMGDRGSIAQVEDSRARVLLGEGRFAEAALTAARAVAVLEAGEQYQLLVEALTTRGVALARAQRDAESLAVFVRAQEIALERLGTKSAQVVGRTMIEELAARITLAAGVPFEQAVLSFEAGMIRAALQQTDNKITAAAAKLKLSAQNLSYLLQARHHALRPTSNRKQRSDANKPKGNLHQFRSKRLNSKKHC